MGQDTAGILGSMVEQGSSLMEDSEVVLAAMRGTGGTGKTAGPCVCR